MSQYFWPEWARNLQHHPLKGVIQTFLEGSGPLKIILAQLMFAGSPFVNASHLDGWQAVAHMLEEDSESHEFAALLKEENHP